MNFSAIEPPDESYAERARARQKELTKPPGSLGKLESIAVRLAAIQRRDEPRSFGRRVLVFAGSHGVTAEGVSPYPSEVTRQMLSNFAAGGAGINALSREAGAEVVVVDVGVAPGTRNFVREPAMTAEETEGALERGREEARRAREDGIALVGLGEMGIGNTTSASAITAVLTTLPPEKVTGPGTGLDPAGVRHKCEVIERALARHRPSPGDPLRLLQCVGGFEIAALAGLCLEAAALRVAIVVDGFISTAAFAIAAGVEDGVKDYAFFSHLSPEPGHRALLGLLDGEPLLDLGLRLGEGTGAALALPILGAAIAAHNEMATFEKAGVSKS
ncbi:MAG: nicotinate-nucleotide--dimethylbenzimidazole phosphoribosyltransferase [Vicinamibacteria bacterium]